MRPLVDRMSESIPTTLDWAHRSISIAIISRGRPGILDDTLESIFRQSQQPQQVIVVVPTVEDVPRRSWGESVQFIVGPHGGCVQRNKALEAIPLSVDYVGFFDDDIELRVDFLEQATLFMRRNPTTIAFSGHLLADGNGVTRAEARGLLAHHTHGENLNGLFRCKGKFHSLHGCNMIVRRSILDYERFDENLPLYSFAEDYDLSMRLERYGNIGKFGLCIGVHLASPGGRVREVLRGYSFVANPWYFLKKGTVHLPPFLAWVRFWLAVFAKTFLFTLWKVLTRDRSLDWAGRLKGILLAFQDIVLGRSHPRRILEL
jgi:glycosyltransferase involved in cell wall biosynthesis